MPVEIPDGPDGISACRGDGFGDDLVLAGNAGAIDRGGEYVADLTELPARASSMPRGAGRWRACAGRASALFRNHSTSRMAAGEGPARKDEASR